MSASAGPARKRLWPAALFLLLGSCASPDPRLYTLVPVDGPAIAASGVIALRPVSVPGYADRPEIVRSAAEYRVRLAGNDRWAEPLGDLVQRVLAADLARRLPAAMVVSGDGPISAPATRVIEIDVTRIDSDGAGQAVLEARIAVREAGEGGLASRAVRLTTPIASPAMADYAASVSAALGQLADAAAQLCQSEAP